MDLNRFVPKNKIEELFFYLKKPIYRLKNKTTKTLDFKITKVSETFWFDTP